MKTVMTNLSKSLLIFNLLVLLVMDTDKILAQQQQSGFACTDFENLDRFLISTKVYVNFHFILDGNGEGNFRLNDDGNGSSNVTAITIANQLISEANYTLANLEQNASKDCLGHQVGYVPDAKYQLEIYYEANDPDEGIHFIEDQQIYETQRGGNFPNLKSTYTVYGDKVIDIFMFAQNFGSNCDVWGEAASPGSVLNMWCMWHYYVNSNPVYNDYEKLLNHEILHNIGLSYEANNAGSCPLSGVDPTEESQFGNNIMRNNGGDKTALSPKQFTAIQGFLPLRGYTELDVECNSNNSPIIIPTGQEVVWDSPTRINSEVIVEPLATLIINCDVQTNSRILVQRSGKLIVEGATITSLCPKTDFWPGIQVDGSTKQHTQVNPYSQLVTGDPGVVLLNNAVIDHAVVGVTSATSEHVWDKSYGGGIIQATITTFSNNRKAIAFYPYRNQNVSYFEECTFSSSNGYAGISMWDVHGVEIRDCDFDNMGPGITLYSPNSTSNPTTTTGDVGIITIDASPTIFNNCTFQNLTHAIDAKSSIDLASFGRGGFNLGKKSVQQSYPPNLFNNNKNHVFSLGILGMNIFNNNFKNSEEAVYFSGRSKYQFFSNEVSSFTVGLMSRFAGELTNSIDHNKWVSTNSSSDGIKVFGNNQNLAIHQNCFNVKRDDWFVLSNNLNNQGSNQNPAVNLFTHLTTESRDINSRARNFSYWHHDPNLISGLDVKLIPLCAVNDRAQSCIITSIHSNRKSLSQVEPILEINCTLDQVGFPNDSLEESAFDSLDYVYWKTRRDNIIDIIDGGDSSGLIYQIVNQPNTQNTLQALANASPYLSVEVIDEVINSTIQTNYKYHILTLNSPLPIEFKLVLEEEYSTQKVDSLLGDYYNPFPALRDTLFAALDESNYNRIAAGLYLIKQRIMQEQYAAATNFITDLGSHEIDRLIFSIKLAEQDVSGAYDFLDNYSIESNSDQAWVDVSRIALRLDTTSHEFILTTEEDSLLEATSLSYLPEAGQASALLYILKEKLYDISEDVYNAPEGIILLNDDKIYKNKLFNKMKIFPNPVLNHVNINFYNLDLNNSHLRLINSQGLTIASYVLTDALTTYNLDISELKEGIYIFQFIGNKNEVESRIFVKL